MTGVPSWVVLIKRFFSLSLLNDREVSCWVGTGCGRAMRQAMPAPLRQRIVLWGWRWGERIFAGLE